MEVFTQLILNLKRINEDYPMNILLVDPSITNCFSINNIPPFPTFHQKDIVRNENSDRICSQSLSDLKLLPEYT